MKAEVGDWLVMKGSTTGRRDQRGLITEVGSANGAPPYVVHWVDDDRVTTVFPGHDAIVISAAEHREAVQREQRRVVSVQNEISAAYPEHR